MNCWELLNINPLATSFTKIDSTSSNVPKFPQYNSIPGIASNDWPSGNIFPGKFYWK